MTRVAIKGTDWLAFFRNRDDHQTQDAEKLYFMTDFSISEGKEVSTETTVDGSHSTVNDGETTASFTSLAYRDSSTVAVWDKLRDSFRNNKLIEFWLVDIGSIDTSQGYEQPVKTEYHQGYFTSFELNSSAEGMVEASFELVVNGKSVKGQETLSEDQFNVAVDKQYTYQSMKAQR